MDAEDIAIKADGIYKNFKLPHERTSSLKSMMTGLFSKNSISFENQHALKDVSFEIKKGDFFGIVGRNGSGKSTLLKILAGIYQPTKGTVGVYGKLVPFIELGVGFNPELTGKENVYLNGALLGFTKKEMQKHYNDIVAFAELERFMDQKLKNYSSGMQVRLAFSVATRANADILLIDEVLAVGDADFQRKCFEYFKELKKSKKTVVFVSHDMNAIREYCNRAVLIDDSRLVAKGGSEAIAKEYTRLFSAPQVSAHSDSSKWGAGGIDILRVATSQKTYGDSDTHIDISVTLEATQDFEKGIIPGFTIKDEAGRALCGTNSKIIRAQNIRLAKGETKTHTWTVPNIFNEGRLTVEPAVSDGATMKICQWWNDAYSFRVTNEQKTPYPVAPKITLSADG